MIGRESSDVTLSTATRENRGRAKLFNCCNLSSIYENFIESRQPHSIKHQEDIILQVGYLSLIESSDRTV